MHCCPDEFPQAKGDTRRQEAEENLPPTRSPERRAGGQAHTSTYPEQAKHAEHEADNYSGESIGEDERKDRDNRSNGEQKKRGDRCSPGGTAEILWINAQLFSCQRIQGRIALLHQIRSQLIGRFLLETFRLINQRQLFLFFPGGVL